MPQEMMNTREVARYLDIHEKQVYALVKTGKIPASRVTGKWLFPKKVIDEWVETHAHSGLRQAREKGGRIQGALLAAGSNDPVLDILQTCLRMTHPEFLIFSANTGSTEGLKALAKGYTDLAWSHLLDPATGEYNIPHLERLAPDVKAVVVNLFHRELGFVAARGNPKRIRDFKDLARPGVRFLNRQAGSGTRLLLDQRLEQGKLQAERISGYDREVFTHMEIGLAILAGEADTGIATAAVSNFLGLDFVPITRERFDMICGQSTFFQKGVQALVQTLTGEAFRQRVARLESYDFSQAGQILYSNP